MSPATLVTIAKLAMHNQVIKIPVKLATMLYLHKFNQPQCLHIQRITVQLLILATCQTLV